MEFNLVTFIIVIIGGLTIGILNQLFKAFMVPSEWMFKNRHHIEGMTTNIIVVFTVLFLHDQKHPLILIAVSLAIGGSFGYFLMGYITKRNFIKLTGKIESTKPDSGSILLTDLAIHKEKDINIMGQLFINNKGLIFMPIDTEKSIVEINLHDIKESMIIKNSFGIPCGLMVNDNIQFSLSYPKLWIKKINAA